MKIRYDSWCGPRSPNGLAQEPLRRSNLDLTLWPRSCYLDDRVSLIPSAQKEACQICDPNGSVVPPTIVVYRWFTSHLKVSWNWGYTQIIHFVWVFHYKPTIFGIPQYWTPSFIDRISPFFWMEYATEKGADFLSSRQISVGWSRAGSGFRGPGLVKDLPVYLMSVPVSHWQNQGIPTACQVNFLDAMDMNDFHRNFETPAILREG